MKVETGWLKMFKCTRFIGTLRDQQLQCFSGLY